MAKQNVWLFPAAVRPAGLNAEALAASREIEETLRSDLELTGIFVIQDAEDLRTLAAHRRARDGLRALSFASATSSSS